MRVFGRVFMIVLLLGAIGAIGFGVWNAGYQQGLVETVETTADVVVTAPYYPGYYGFGVFGLIFKVFFVFLLFGLLFKLVFGRRYWQHHSGQVVTSYRSAINTQGVISDITVSGAELVEVDPLPVHQVISNLVGNALRVMPDGGRLDVNVDTGVITVADTGPGIPEDQLPFVFDRFVKASDSTGSGLGLSIARDLVEAHKRSITAVNRPGGGAVFQVELSYLRTSSDPPPDRCPPAPVALTLSM